MAALLAFLAAFLGQPRIEAVPCAKPHPVPCLGHCMRVNARCGDRPILPAVAARGRR